MIAGLVDIFIFQGLGELVSRFAAHFIPGPVNGLVLLLAWLHIRGGVPPPLDLVASGPMRHLGLRFVPAAVGVILFRPQLKANPVAIAVAIVAGFYAKSVTAPVAMGVAERVHASPTLTAVFAISTGMLGAILIPLFFR